MKFADHLEVQALWSDNEMFQPISAMMGISRFERNFYYRSTTNAFPKNS